MKRAFPFSEVATTEDEAGNNKPFIFCDICEGEDTPAHFFCAQCNKYYCKDCEADFHSRGSFSKHNRRYIPSNFGRLNCISHIDSPLTLFCLDDNGIQPHSRPYPQYLHIHIHNISYVIHFIHRNDMHCMPRQRQAQRAPCHRL